MFNVTLDCGTTHLTVKRFGYEGLKNQNFGNREAAIERARDLSIGMKGLEVALVCSDDTECQGVELHAFQNGVEVERQGSFIKRAVTE